MTCNDSMKYKKKTDRKDIKSVIVVKATQLGTLKDAIAAATTGSSYKQLNYPGSNYINHTLKETELPSQAS